MRDDSLQDGKGMWHACMSVRPYSTESISCTTLSVVLSRDCSTSGRAVPLSFPLQQQDSLPEVAL